MDVRRVSAFWGVDQRRWIVSVSLLGIPREELGWGGCWTLKGSIVCELFCFVFVLFFFFGGSAKWTKCVHITSVVRLTPGEKKG